MRKDKKKKRNEDIIMFGSDVRQNNCVCILFNYGE